MLVHEFVRVPVCIACVYVLVCRPSGCRPPRGGCGNISHALPV